jgi:DNA-binding transcriptional MerR regulator
MTVATRLKIGDVAKQTGVAVGALRYYESLGLLQSERGDNGYRYYGAQAIQQVQFIKKAQALGFSLEDVGEILSVHQQGDMPCLFVQALLQTKIEQLEAQIEQMVTFKTALEQYRDRWAHHQPHAQPGDICPLIETVTLGP